MRTINSNNVNTRPCKNVWQKKGNQSEKRGKYRLHVAPGIRYLRRWPTNLSGFPPYLTPAKGTFVLHISYSCTKYSVRRKCTLIQGGRKGRQLFTLTILYAVPFVLDRPRHEHAGGWGVRAKGSLEPGHELWVRAVGVGGKITTSSFLVIHGCILAVDW
jgi:hypothetical protein